MLENEPPSLNAAALHALRPTTREEKNGEKIENSKQKENN
jgi:hypothetical protein